MRPKTLRIIAWCIIAFAVLFGSCELAFDIFIAHLGAGTGMLFLIAVLLNIVLGTLLFMWADILEGRNKNGPAV
jgi:hypothetical protein